MRSIRLGRTGLSVNSLGFGVLPLQRTALDEAVRILRRAVEGGVNFFDTARMYSDSEAKIGAALYGLRGQIILATKSVAPDAAGMERDLAESLAALRTDYLDIYQVHNAKSLPVPGDGSGRYEFLEGLKRSGRIRAIGLTSHSLDVALQAVRSGLYESVQFPFSLLSSEEETELVRACEKTDVGFIAMKALAGGMIGNIPAAFSHIARFGNVLPIWGMQTMAELEEFLALEAAPPPWDRDMEKAALAEREALKGSFCRACGYCLPCPQDIEIPNLVRLSRLLRRSPWRDYATREWQAKITAAKSCIQCKDCASRCPYSLDPPALLVENVTDYEQFMRERGVMP